MFGSEEDGRNARSVDRRQVVDDPLGIGLEGLFEFRFVWGAYVMTGQVKRVSRPFRGTRLLDFFQSVGFEKELSRTLRYRCTDICAVFQTIDTKIQFYRVGKTLINSSYF